MSLRPVGVDRDERALALDALPAQIALLDSDGVIT